jgi:aspartate/methionine/tyrosine aminotransferase
MPPLPDFRLETYLARWEFAARFHMTASDAESMSLADLLRLAEPGDGEAFEHLWLGYVPTFGGEALRHTVASLYSSVVSKVYGLPGLRIGWIAAQDHDLLERMERIKHYLSICNSGPGEALAVIALKARERILDRNRALINANLKCVGEFFTYFTDLFGWETPDAGTVGYPRYKGADGVETFARRLVEEANVLLLPASIFRSELTPLPEDRFRIGYGRSYVPAGLEAMREWLARK